MASSEPRCRACCTGLGQVFPCVGALPQPGLGNDLAVLYLCTPGPSGQNPFPPYPSFMGEIPG